MVAAEYIKECQWGASQAACVVSEAAYERRGAGGEGEGGQRLLSADDVDVDVIDTLAALRNR